MAKYLVCQPWNKILLLVALFLYGIVLNAQNDSRRLREFKGIISYEVSTNFESDRGVSLPSIYAAVQGVSTIKYYIDGSQTVYIEMFKHSDGSRSIRKNTVDSSHLFIENSNSLINLSTLHKNEGRASVKLKKTGESQTMLNMVADIFEYKDNEYGEYGEVAYTDEFLYSFPFSDADAQKLGLPFDRYGFNVYSKLRSEIGKGKYRVIEHMLLEISPDSLLDVSSLGYPESLPVENLDLPPPIVRTSTIIPKKLRVKFAPPVKDIDSKDVAFREYEGEVVYIDLWATWCLPCLESFKDLNNVQKDLINRPFKIVGISVDDSSSTEIWLSTVKAHSLGWSQYLSQHKTEPFEKLVSNFSGIPRYFLLDKWGNLAVDDAPAPSDPNLYTVINNLLLE